MEKFIDLFNRISTTNLRICVTLLLAIGTGIYVWTTGKAIDGNWLIFLGSIGGLDVLQYASKSARLTQTTNAAVPVANNMAGGGVGGTVTEFLRAEDAATTDVQELNKKG